MDALFVVTRVLHVGLAIVLVGGSFFLRFVLLPAATESLSDAEHQRLRERVLSLWKRFVHSGIGVLLISGGINYGRKIMMFREAQIREPLYHALLGTKILLALAVFFIASALVGKSPGLSGIRQNPKKWLTINLLLAGIIVAISGFLRIRYPS